MRIRGWQRLAGLLVVCVLFAGSALAGGNKATVIIQKQSKNKGEIVFGFTPGGGEQEEITVTVVEKMGPGDIAKDIHKELAFRLTEGYVIKLDGNKVVIKTQDKNATFELLITKQSVQGTSIAIK
jgi:ribosomal protein L14